MKKLQYHKSDLSTLLNIGEIRSMEVVKVGKDAVLRIICEDAEYETVRARKDEKPKKVGLAGKVGDALGEWAKKPMRRPDEW
jgi:hypothetical protein